MNELVHINNYALPVKVYNGQRVITFDDMDSVHERPSGTASRNFRKNKKRFIENEDYFFLSFDEARSTNFVQRPNSQGHILITESGYMMLVKSFTDDLAWEVQRKLVRVYFRAKEFLKHQQLNPQWHEARQNSKAIRLQETDEIKRYVEYCEQHGSKNAKRYYTTLSNLVNNALGLTTGQRDEATYETLQLISLLENTIRLTIMEEVQKATEYHQIYQVCKEKIAGVMSYIYLPEQRLLTG